MVPEGWERVCLSDVAEINPRRKIPKGQMVPFVEMAAVPEGGPGISYLMEREGSSSGAKFQNGDTLFARITPCAQNGKIALVTCLPGGQCGQGSTEFIVLGPKANKLDAQYLYFLARSHRVHSYAVSKMEGTSGRQRVPNRVFSEIDIALPPLPEQKKIAAILGSVDEAIQATQAVIDQTRKVKQGLLQQLLTRGIGHTRFKQTEIGEIPEGWQPITLGEIAEFINGRGFKPHEWQTTGLPIIRIQNLNGGPEFNYYQGEYNPKILVPRETLLFAWSGSRGTSFGPHIWHGPDGLLNYHTWKINCGPRVLKDFLYYALKKITVQVERDAHGASALVHMQKRYIEEYKVPLPPLEEQQLIAERLGAVDEAGKQGGAKLAQLEIVKKGLMQDLLTGRVRVGDVEGVKAAV